MSSTSALMGFSAGFTVAWLMYGKDGSEKQAQPVQQVQPEKYVSPVDNPAYSGLAPFVFVGLGAAALVGVAMQEKAKSGARRSG